MVIALYHKTKTKISFWCKPKSNFRYLIQRQDTLPVKQTRTHRIFESFKIKKWKRIEG